MTIGLELTIARIVNGRSAKEVAKDARVHPTDLSRIERGWLKPTTEQEARIKEAAGWSPFISFFVRMVHDSSITAQYSTGRQSLQPAQGEQQTASELTEAS